MNNVPVIVRESIFCHKEGKEIPIDDCMKCILNKKKTRIGFTTFVQCDYMEEDK
ncbi:MAG: hypothetical protein BWY95_02332 [Bacteroidetes bacterium ADurb.BinA104]|nr:MAG: hypothetical protein BWY95_02332 [Bacteroidetes bacterium ADurb.BinA104]